MRRRRQFDDAPFGAPELSGLVDHVSVDRDLDRLVHVSGYECDRSRSRFEVDTRLWLHGRGRGPIDGHGRCARVTQGDRNRDDVRPGVTFGRRDRARAHDGRGGDVPCERVGRVDRRAVSNRDGGAVRTRRGGADRGFPRP